MRDLDQIGLVGHHVVDALVRAGDFVEHTRVLAAHDALRLLDQFSRREGLSCLVAAHPAPGAVRAGMEALRRALAADDVAARAHAARDDAELAGTGADRALARQPDALAEVRLPLDVVMVAVDRGAGRLER